VRLVRCGIRFRLDPAGSHASVPSRPRSHDVTLSPCDRDVNTDASARASRRAARAARASPAAGKTRESRCDARRLDPDGPRAAGRGGPTLTEDPESAAPREDRSTAGASERVRVCACACCVCACVCVCVCGDEQPPHTHTHTHLSLSLQEEGLILIGSLAFSGVFLTKLYLHLDSEHVTKTRCAAFLNSKSTEYRLGFFWDERTGGREGERTRGREDGRARGREDERTGGREDGRARGREGGRARGREDGRTGGPEDGLSGLCDWNSSLLDDVTTSAVLAPEFTQIIHCKLFFCQKKYDNPSFFIIL